jgi:hypothetical protein
MYLYKISVGVPWYIWHNLSSNIPRWAGNFLSSGVETLFRWVRPPVPQGGAYRILTYTHAYTSWLFLKKGHAAYSHTHILYVRISSACSPGRGLPHTHIHIHTLAGCSSRRGILHTHIHTYCTSAYHPPVLQNGAYRILT